MFGFPRQIGYVRADDLSPTHALCLKVVPSGELRNRKKDDVVST